MRQMMQTFISDQPGFEVSGTVCTAEEALDALPDDADLVLVDISLPAMNGIDLIGQIQARWPELPCLVCSGHSEVTYVERALAAGARGYVAKGDPAELTEALQCMRRGEAYLSASLRERVAALAAPDEDGG